MTRDFDLPVLPMPQKPAFQSGSVKRSSLRSVALHGRLPRSLAKQVQQFARRNRLVQSARERASILIGMDSGAAPSRPEGYALKVGNQIVLNAGDAPGLFYGLQTLQQIFDAKALIPRCTIEDWPALPLRGFYFDLTRQVPTTDFLKAIVDRLATVKINLLMIQYREFFPYEGFPLIVSGASYTAGQIAEFVRYARERHIQVVPLLQSLSFQEHILRAQAYAHLRERPEDVSGMCPTHPESFRLYCSLAEQLIAAHPGLEYFHLGADEASSVGHCERCKRAMGKGSKATLVTAFTNKIIQFLLNRGLRPMMWADMLFGHLEDRAAVSRYVRDMFADLSREVIAADWDYWSTGPKTPARSPYPGIAGLQHVARLQDAGFRVVGMPSCSHTSNAGNNSIDHRLAFANVTAFAKELRRRGCLGMVMTHWPTNALCEVRWDQRHSGKYVLNEVVDLAYSQVRPGLEAHWYTIWRAAECAWSNAPRTKDQYDRAFARTFLGTSDRAYPEALFLASIPIRRWASRRRVLSHSEKERVGQAVQRMRKARRSATKAAAVVSYSDLFIRIQRHELQWREFRDALPHFNAPKLSQQQRSVLRGLVTERKVLEREFRRIYLTIYKDVHLEEEVELRFCEERRLQEQLLWDERRRARS